REGAHEIREVIIPFRMASVPRFS
ncbi:MAG: hypothetical protein JWM82_3525, partial [Myxococcales bacterium]|nr:hypothetical protein [Myxococcales bacterium]